VSIPVPLGLLGRIVQWSLHRDPYTGRRPIVSAVPFLVGTVGIGAYAAIATGRVNGSVVFLGLSAGVVVVALRQLWDSASALFREPPEPEIAVATGRRRKELEREKAALLKALKELEFDHQMRKVSDVDFSEISGVYRARAIRVMRQLDDRQVDYTRLVEEELIRHRKEGRIAARAEAIYEDGGGSRRTQWFLALGGLIAIVSVISLIRAGLPRVWAILFGLAGGGGFIVRQLVYDAPARSIARGRAIAQAKEIEAAEERLIAEAPASKVAPARTCASCTTLNDPDAVFCKKCAARLVPEATT
jgi:hypothetical protein